MTIPAHVPTVPVAKYISRGIVITCCYCGGRHIHQYPQHRSTATTLWVSVGCGLFRSGDDRLTGYRINYQPKGA